MFKFIKWELIDEIHKNMITGIIIAIIFFAIALVPNNIDIYKYLLIPFQIAILAPIVLAFTYGTKRTIESYEKRTFLLESMLSLSAYWLLLAKFIIAIIINLVYSLVFVIGFSILANKATSLGIVEKVIELSFQFHISNENKVSFLILLLLSSTAFSSLVTFLFLGFKGFRPKSRRSKLFGCVFGVVLYGATHYFLHEFFGESYIIINILLFVIIGMCYFIGVMFIKYKFEVCQ